MRGAGVQLPKPVLTGLAAAAVAVVFGSVLAGFFVGFVFTPPAFRGALRIGYAISSTGEIAVLATVLFGPGISLAAFFLGFILHLRARRSIIFLLEAAVGGACAAMIGAFAWPLIRGGRPVGPLWWAALFAGTVVGLIFGLFLRPTEAVSSRGQA